MIKLINIILIVLLFSCVQVKPKKVFSLPNFNDINDIIETIVLKDSLPVLLDNSESDTVHTKGLPDYIIHHGNKPLSVDLSKMKVIVPEISPKGLTRVYLENMVDISELLNAKVKGENFFSEDDSLYFLFQNDTLKQFRINEKFANKLTQTTFAEQSNRRKTNERINYYDLTIPVFSLDNKKAYVEVTYNCSGLCGGATAIYLEKINGVWTIMHTLTLWIS